MAMSAATEDATLSAAPQTDAGSQEELRQARFDVARLRLALRKLTHEADGVEALDGTTEPVVDDAVEFDLAAARELLASSLSQRLDARRAELAADLEAARAEAARLVESAHRRAAEYVAGAHDDVFGAVFHPDQPLGPLPALPLEVVADPGGPSPSEGTPAGEATLLAPSQGGAIGFEAMVAVMQAFLTQAAVAGPAPAAPVAVVRRPRRPLRTRVLHADVILPLIAVAAVLVILIAWVG
jgi:hypothetical protein